MGNDLQHVRRRKNGLFFIGCDETFPWCVDDNSVYCTTTFLRRKAAQPVGSDTQHGSLQCELLPRHCHTLGAPDDVTMQDRGASNSEKKVLGWEHITEQLEG